MADCCSEIRAELAALRAEIAKLKPVDEQRIIAASVQQAKDVIIPIALGYILSQLKPIQAAIFNLEGLLGNLETRLIQYIQSLLRPLNAQISAAKIKVRLMLLGMRRVML